MNNYYKVSISLLCLGTLIWGGCCGHGPGATNHYIAMESIKTPEKGIYWPEGQAFPHFARPAEPLDAISVKLGDMTDTEKITFAVFQGLINRNTPRVLLLDVEREGANKWPENLGLKTVSMPAERKWELVRKYKDELAGLILYSTEKSEHYKNLASTAAGLANALPVTAAEHEALKNACVQLPVVEDLTGLGYTSPTEIYQHLYDHYWKNCTRRLLLSLKPKDGYIRDIGTAAGAAVVWLDVRNHNENTVMRKFLRDMKAGESILLGWWADERSGIGIGTEYGISTVPADFYENATVYGGMSHQIDLPVTPRKPALENKIYLAVFLSDGDNVQYCQHAMSGLWDNPARGTIPINWTVSPALADLGPGLLNFYYNTSTPNDFLASGPSGLGYALIHDAHNRVWNTTGREDIDPYTILTERYLERSGLRVITVWDDINDAQMESYASNCRYLYGVTREDWGFGDRLTTRTKQDRLAFVPNFPCYAPNTDRIYDQWKDIIASFDGSRPLFLAAQGESWKMGPESILRLKERLDSLSQGNIVICRGDHFFTLYNEAEGLDFNLTMSGAIKITSSRSTTPAQCAADGSCSTRNQWVSAEKGNAWIEFDLGRDYSVSRYVVRHAATSGLNPSLNTCRFDILASIDGATWEKVDSQRGNTAAVTDAQIDPVRARYLKIEITDPGSDGLARISDVEIYGKTLR